MMMHMMPWFNHKHKHSHWTMQMDVKDGLYVSERYHQFGRVAAHYTPMIGPYESNDRETIKLQLKLMKLAGVNGVILNWYGIQKRYDYPDNLVASDIIINETSAAGMLWTLCYEDRTISTSWTAAEQSMALHNDWAYIRDHYIARFPGVLREGNRATGRPIFINFGPVVFKKPSDWNAMFAAVFHTEESKPRILGVDTGGSTRVECPDGDFSWPGHTLFQTNATVLTVTDWASNFYTKAIQNKYHPVIGAVFPRYHDYYTEGNVGITPKSWWGRHVDAFGGATLAKTMEMAHSQRADVVQIATWNDWQEGTMIEPSAEEGFRQLLHLQQSILGYQDEAPMLHAVRDYNAVKASIWQRCDYVPASEREVCGDATTTEKSCEAARCCWRATSVANRPSCFHGARKPVCTCNHVLRNCTATPQDRLCCCSHAGNLLQASSQVEVQLDVSTMAFGAHPDKARDHMGPNIFLVSAASVLAVVLLVGVVVWLARFRSAGLATFRWKRRAKVVSRHSSTQRNKPSFFFRQGTSTIELNRPSLGRRGTSIESLSVPEQSVRAPNSPNPELKEPSLSRRGNSADSISTRGPLSSPIPSLTRRGTSVESISHEPTRVSDRI